MINYNVPVTQKLKTVSGTIPASRFSTLYSNPYEILPSPSGVVNAYIPISFTIWLRWTLAGSPTLYLLGNFATIDQALPTSHGAFCSVKNLFRDPVNAKWFTLGITAEEKADENYNFGAPIVFMTDVDDTTGTFLNCPYTFSYYEHTF